jgi:ABC-2 type transport system permease protein
MTFAQTSRIAWGIAKRSLMLIPRVPSTFFPSLVMPLFLTITFAGAFSGLTMIPGFPAAKAIDWFIPMTVVQGSAFAGITIGLGVARDLENGFYDRLLLSPAPRSALVAGPLIAGVLRAIFPLTLLLITAFLADANLPGGALGIVTLSTASLGIGLVGGAWSLGLSLRFRTMQAAPLMQMGVFLSVFLSTAQMPLHLISGWLHDVARVNPMTNVLALAREGFLGEVTWSGTWPGLVSLAAIALGLVLFAAREMRRISP